MSVGNALDTGAAISLGGTLTTAGAFTTSGAYGTTFTFTNTTAVTFPTSGTLATVGSPYTIVDQNASTSTLAVNTINIVDNGATLVTMTLPTTAAQGSIFKIIGGSAGGWKVNVASGQTIHVGSTASTASTGSIASSNQYDALEIYCTTANTTFACLGVQGNITVV